MKNDDETEKAAKQIKLSLKDQRIAKVKADLTAASVIVAAITTADATQQIYLGPVKGGIDTHVNNLKSMSHDMHEMQLQESTEDQVAAAWGKIVVECQELKKHLDVASSMLYPGNFKPHTTPYDATLSVQQGVQ